MVGDRPGVKARDPALPALLVAVKEVNRKEPVVGIRVPHDRSLLLLACLRLPEPYASRRDVQVRTRRVNMLKSPDGVSG